MESVGDVALVKEGWRGINQTLFPRRFPLEQLLDPGIELSRALEDFLERIIGISIDKKAFLVGQGPFCCFAGAVQDELGHIGPCDFRCFADEAFLTHRCPEPERRSGSLRSGILEILGILEY
jgi:hypothetical protein